MGNLSEQMIESQQEDNNKKLAAYLGIEYGELSSLDFEWHDQTGSSGEGLYGYYIRFSDESDAEILRKIKGIDMKTKSVDIDLNWNDQPDID